MPTPVFVHVLSNGDVWASCDQFFKPSGTVVATYSVSGLVRAQKIGTLSGNAGSYAASGSTGIHGKEFS